MKRLLLIAMGLLFFGNTCLTLAATNAQTGNKFEFGVDAGIAIPLSPSGLTDSNGVGVGGGAFGRYILNPNTSLGLALSYNSYSGKSVSGYDYPTFSTLETLAQGKTRFGKGSIHPYILYGFGLCTSHTAETSYTASGNMFGFTYSYKVTTPSVSTTDFELQPGFGVEFGSKTKFFAETKLSVVLTSGDTLMFLPVNVGVQF
jgi:hypothetical protein